MQSVHGRVHVIARLFGVLMMIGIFSTNGIADDGAIELRQAAQCRAQRMARDLVTTVLDGQLRQLEANGLADEPIYREIAGMRRDIDDVIEGSMARVVEQLVAAEQATGAQRQQKYAAARASTREVVLQLGVARQAVLRRIRSAELAEQVARMLELQRRVSEETTSLSELPPEWRADRAVNVLADQRDIAPLLTGLVESLEEVAKWDGEIAINASAARQWVEEADLGKDLASAERALQRADYSAATANQEIVLRRFEELWNRLDVASRRRRGATNLLEQVRDLLMRQQVLRDEAASGDATDLSLVEGQQTLAQDVKTLAEPLAGDPTLAPLQQQAEAAAIAATVALFGEKAERGLAEQERVLDRLEALAELLASMEHDRHDRSAAEWAKAIAQLEQARATLLEVDDASKMVQDGEEYPVALAEQLEKSANELTESAAIAARIESAARAIRENEAPRAALQQARAALEETLADWKRAEIAVRIGELARAAEALERSAAAERTIGDVGDRESGSGDRAGWGAIHGDVMAVARATMEGIRPAAPKAADQVGEALDRGESLADALKGDEPPYKEVSERAGAMSQALSGAAARLREVIGRSAAELVELTEGQMPPVAKASQTVEAAASQVKTGEANDLTETTKRAIAQASEADFAGTIAAQAALRAAGERNLVDATAALERAAISLAARAKQLEEARSLSEQLGQLAQMQQAAVDAIGTARQELTEAPREVEQMSEAQRQAARQMRSSTQQFAATQRATGEAAARISQQRQLANAAIREALQAAGRLPVPTPPPAETADSTAQAKAAQQGSSQEPPPSPPGEGEPGTEQAPGTKTASSGAAGQKQAGASSSNNGASSGKAIGTEMVPAAAQETAQMMAGARAQAAMSALEAARVASDELAASQSGAPLPEGVNNPGNRRPSDAEAAPDGPTASTAGAPPAEGTAPSSKASEDVAVPGGTGGEAGWFAKLPADVRAAIRAGSSQPAPRGYEERLERYFESVEPGVGGGGSGETGDRGMNSYRP